MVSSRRSPGSEHGFCVMFDVSRCSGSPLDHCYLTTVPLLLFSLLFAYVSHHIMLSRCCNLTTLPLPFPLSFASLDTHGNGIAESSWLTDYYNNSCRYRLCDDHDARAMLACVEFFFCFFFDQGIGSRSAAWASRVDVV